MSTTLTDLEIIARHIGYEWAMLLGATETEWHTPETIRALNVAQRAPLRVVHLHARTELVWLHARVLYDFLFKQNLRSDDFSVISFISVQASQDWNQKYGFRADDLCPTLESHFRNGGRANKKLFHGTSARFTDLNGLPEYATVRDELRRGFSKCYDLMAADHRDVFRQGINVEWDVADVVIPFSARTC